jgi:hypothetical protein
MKHLRAPAVLIVAVGFAAILVAAALGARSVPFTGSYAGTATEKVDGQMVTAVSSGTGKNNVVGKSTIRGTVVANTTNSSATGCAPFNGPGTIASPKGKLNVTVLTTSRGCAASEEDQNNISLSGTVKVISGTGKFKKATGSLHFSGHYDRSNGAFTVKITGKLRYPK